MDKILASQLFPLIKTFLETPSTDFSYILLARTGPMTIPEESGIVNVLGFQLLWLRKQEKRGLGMPDLMLQDPRLLTNLNKLAYHYLL